MPKVNGKEYDYTPAGIAAAKAARKAKGAANASSSKPKTKAGMTKSGYNISRNIGYWCKKGGGASLPLPQPHSLGGLSKGIGISKGKGKGIGYGKKISKKNFKL